MLRKAENVVKKLHSHRRKPTRFMSDRELIGYLRKIVYQYDNLTLKEKIKKISKLIKKHKDRIITAKDHDGNTALLTMLGCGFPSGKPNGNYLEIIQELLDAGADVNVAGRNGYTPLMSAAEYKQDDYLKLLLKYNPNIHAKTTDYHETALHYALHNSLECLQILIDLRCDVNVHELHSSPLTSAAGTGKLLALKMLIKAGANLNDQNPHGETALYRAIDNGHDDYIDELIAAGADVNCNKLLTKACCLARSSYNAQPDLDLFRGNCIAKLIAAGADFRSLKDYHDQPITVADLYSRLRLADQRSVETWIALNEICNYQKKHRMNYGEIEAYINKLNKYATRMSKKEKSSTEAIIKSIDQSIDSTTHSIHKMPLELVEIITDYSHPHPIPGPLFKAAFLDDLIDTERNRGTETRVRPQQPTS